jgi:antitoxin component of RelBE/YafQ-DinJ toxin-antitoxin module
MTTVDGKKVIYLRVDEALHSRISSLAQSSGMTMASVIRVLLTTGLYDDRTTQALDLAKRIGL